MAHTPEYGITPTTVPVYAPDMKRPNPAVVAGLQRAIDHFRWCWDCGTRETDCRATTAPAGKCCPDCRHRDTGASYLAPLFATDGAR